MICTTIFEDIFEDYTFMKMKVLHEDENHFSGNLRRYEDLKINFEIIFEDLKI